MGLFLNKSDILQFNHIPETFSSHKSVPEAYLKILFPNASVIKGSFYTPTVDKTRHFFLFKISIIFLIVWLQQRGKVFKLLNSLHSTEDWIRVTWAWKLAKQTILQGDEREKIIRMAMRWKNYEALGWTKEICHLVPFFMISGAKSREGSWVQPSWQGEDSVSWSRWSLPFPVVLPASGKMLGTELVPIAYSWNQWMDLQQSHLAPWFALICLSCKATRNIQAGQAPFLTSVCPPSGSINLHKSWQL